MNIERKVRGIVHFQDKILLIRTEESRHEWVFLGGAVMGSESPRTVLQQKAVEKIGTYMDIDELYMILYRHPRVDNPCLENFTQLVDIYPAHLKNPEKIVLGKRTLEHAFVIPKSAIYMPITSVTHEILCKLNERGYFNKEMKLSSRRPIEAFSYYG